MIAESMKPNRIIDHRQRIRRVAAHIDEHIDEKLNLQTLAVNHCNDILNLSYNRNVAGFQSYDFNATAYGGNGNETPWPAAKARTTSSSSRVTMELARCRPAPAYSKPIVISTTMPAATTWCS